MFFKQSQRYIIFQRQLSFTRSKNLFFKICYFWDELICLRKLMFIFQLLISLIPSSVKQFVYKFIILKRSLENMLHVTKEKKRRELLNLATSNWHSQQCSTLPFAYYNGRYKFLRLCGRVLIFQIYGFLFSSWVFFFYNVLLNSRLFQSFEHTLLNIKPNYQLGEKGYIYFALFCLVLNQFGVL